MKHVRPSSPNTARALAHLKSWCEWMALGGGLSMLGGGVPGLSLRAPAPPLHPPRGGGRGRLHERWAGYVPEPAR